MWKFCFLKCSLFLQWDRMTACIIILFSQMKLYCERNHKLSTLSNKSIHKTSWLTAQACSVEIRHWKREHLFHLSTREHRQCVRVVNRQFWAGLCLICKEGLTKNLSYSSGLLCWHLPIIVAWTHDMCSCGQQAILSWAVLYWASILW